MIPVQLILNILAMILGLLSICDKMLETFTGKSTVSHIRRLLKNSKTDIESLMSETKSIMDIDELVETTDNVINIFDDLTFKFNNN